MMKYKFLYYNNINAESIEILNNEINTNGYDVVSYSVFVVNGYRDIVVLVSYDEIINRFFNTQRIEVSSVNIIKE